MLIVVDRDIGILELEGEVICFLFDKEVLCGYFGSIFICRVVGVLFFKV